MTHEEKDNLFIENINFIHYFLHKYYSKYEKSYEDLFGEASLTFYEVLDKYTPEKGKLTTFLTPYLKGCISTYIARDIYHISAYYYRLIAKIMKCDAFPDNQNVAPSPEAIKMIAKSTNLSETTVINALKYYYAGRYLSFDLVSASTTASYNDIYSYI